jgi:hypothetical protein
MWGHSADGAEWTKSTPRVVLVTSGPSIMRGPYISVSFVLGASYAFPSGLDQTIGRRTNDSDVVVWPL